MQPAQGVDVGAHRLFVIDSVEISVDFHEGNYMALFVKGIKEKTRRKSALCFLCKLSSKE